MRRLLPLLLLLAACGQPPVAPAPTGRIAAPTAGALPASADVYVVDPRASFLAITVRRAGPMARLGHDHVVASRSLSGIVAPDAGRAEVSFRAEQMTVDEPQLLREAGIATQPSQEAIEGTRRNMLGPVLEAERFPLVALRAERMDGGHLRVAVTLHGVTRPLELPAAIRIGAAEVEATGTARLQQSDFGIRPLSVGGGLLSVQDELDVRYRIVARR